MRLTLLPTLRGLRRTCSLGAVALALAACGGGGNDAAVVVPAPVAAATTMQGTVAVGAPMLNAVVTVKDAHGTTVSAPVAADGSYSGLSLAGLVAPFSLQACGQVDGSYACFYSVVGQGGVANVTPLTNATVALAMGADPAALFAASGASAPPSAADLAVQADKLRAALGDLLAKAGVGTADFATAPFSADRTGMDKVLDAARVSTGSDGSNIFVQVEGRIGSGNALLSHDTALGALAAGTGLDVDLRGISHIFVDGLSYAVSAADPATCASRMAGANIFDARFVLDLDEGVSVDSTAAPAALCEFMSQQGLLGGVFANPTLRDCDFTTDPAAKLCVVGFNIVRGEARFEGAELAVVLRTGAEWKLLGRDSNYDVHVGAATQRTVRVDAPAGATDAAPRYTRALQFDITGTDGIGDTAVRAARVYQRNLDGSGWEATPLASLVLTDACIAQRRPGSKARLSIVGSQNCGSSWFSLGDSGDMAGASEHGDDLIDNFYRRGRKVRVDLYDNVAFAGTPASLVKRVDGVPPKFAALATFPWLELDAASRASLAAYDGTATALAFAWAANSTVSGHDMSLCFADGCSSNRNSRVEVVLGRSNASLTLEPQPANPAAVRMLNVYGRDHDQAGISTTYVSCGGAARCF